MPILRFQRPTQFTDWLRAYRLFIDGVCVGEINAGSEVEFEVSAGIHEIIARIDWCSSNRLEVAIPERSLRSLEVGSNLSNWRLLFGFLYITLLRSHYLYLRPSWAFSADALAPFIAGEAASRPSGPDYQELPPSIVER